MTEIDYNSREYRRSRMAYSVFCMLEYFVSLLITDVFLFKMLSYIGMDDGRIGVMTSLSTAACLFQLASLGFVGMIRRIKVWVTVCSIASQTVFVLLYLLVFVPLGAQARVVLAAAGLVLGFFLKQSVSAIMFKWANSYVDPHGRATYSAEKEIMSLAGGMIFTFAVGVMMDWFEKRGQLTHAFAGILILGGIICTGSLICLMQIGGKNPEASVQPKLPPLRTVLHVLWHSAGYHRLIFLNLLWTAAQCITVGFLGSYKSRELMLSVSTVQLINIAGNVCRVVLSRPFGRFTDRTSYARGIELGMYLAAAGFAAVVFSGPETRWLIVVFVLFNSVAQAGTGQNLTNIVYDYVPPEYFVQAMSIKNCIAGVCGFAASLAGGALLNDVQSSGNRFMGLEVCGQQILGAVSCILCAAAAVYIHTAMCRPDGESPSVQ